VGQVAVGQPFQADSVRLESLTYFQTDHYLFPLFLTSATAIVYDQVSCPEQLCAEWGKENDCHNAPTTARKGFAAL
jgi:hypothetical protein